MMVNYPSCLTHPGNKVPREYEVKLDNPLDENDKIKLLDGITLEGKRGKFLKLTFPDQKDKKNVICNL